MMSYMVSGTSGVTGTYILETELLQQLVGMYQHPLLHLFLDVPKEYIYLDWKILMGIQKGYVPGGK